MFVPTPWSAAQQPNARDDVEKRLRALEDKTDRLIQAVDRVATVAAPIPSGKPNIYVQRMIAIETKRKEFRPIRNEMERQISFISDALSAAKDDQAKEIVAQAMLTALQKQRVDLAALQRKAGKDTSATGLVGAFLSLMRTDLENMDRSLQEMDEMYDQQQKMGREASYTEMIRDRDSKKK
jgi:flagellar motor component MotA